MENAKDTTLNTCSSPAELRDGKRIKHRPGGSPAKLGDGNQIKHGKKLGKKIVRDDSANKKVQRGRPNQPSTTNRESFDIKAEVLFAHIGAQSNPPPKLAPIFCTKVGNRTTYHLPEGVPLTLVTGLLSAEPSEPGAACRLIHGCDGLDGVEALKALLSFVNKTSKHAEGLQLDLKLLDKAETALLLDCLQSSTCKLARIRKWPELLALMEVCNRDQKVFMVAALMLDQLVSFSAVVSNLPARTLFKAINFKAVCERAVQMARQSSHPFETLQFLSRRSEKFGKCNLESVFEKKNFDITPLIMDACRDLLESGELSSPEAKKVRDWLRPWGEELGEFLPWAVWEALQSPNPGGALVEVAKYTSSLPEGVERYELEAGIDQAIFQLCCAGELSEEEPEAIRKALRPPKK